MLSFRLSAFQVVTSNLEVSPRVLSIFGHNMNGGCAKLRFSGNFRINYGELCFSDFFGDFPVDKSLGASLI